MPVESDLSRLQGKMSHERDDSDEGELSPADEPGEHDPVGSEPSFPGMR